MAAIRLSTNAIVFTEAIAKATLYPAGSSVRESDAEAPERHQSPVLVVEMRDNILEHVQGDGAERDAEALEAAGVPVLREPRQ